MKKFWNDRERLEKEFLHHLGVPDKQYIAKRYQKLWEDILKIRYQLEVYHFPESACKSWELLSAFTKELRTDTFRPVDNNKMLCREVK